MKPQTIVFFITGTARGGAETQLLRLAPTLCAQGRTVHIVSLLPSETGNQAFEVSGLNYHTLNMERGRASPSDLNRAVSLLQKLDGDVLTSFCFHANVLAAFAGKLARVPLIIASIRNEYFGPRSRELMEQTLDLLRMRDVVTTNSHLVAQNLIQRKILAASRTEVIPNGIITEDYHFQEETRLQMRRTLQVEPDDFLWLAIGNLRRTKDYPNLLRAFTKISQRRPRARLFIAGAFQKPDILATIRRQAARLPADRVRLLGVRTDVPDLLAAADAFVLSSLHEGLPNAVMEALASGTPVVATDVGGVRELVIHGINGFVVPPADPDALAHAMLQTIALSPEELHRFKQRSTNFIERHFDLDLVVRRWSELFDYHWHQKMTALFSTHRLRPASSAEP